MNDDDGFEVFGPSQHGRPGDFEEVMAMLRHYVDDHDMPREAALDILIDILRPGNSDNSHDVRPMFVGAMYATGFGYLCDKITSLFINTMPWGVAFSIATEDGFRFPDLGKIEQKGIIMGLCVVLQAGGLTARVSPDNHIILTDEAGEESTMDIDTIVSQFRVEIEQELGADKPDDPTRKWMP